MMHFFIFLFLSLDLAEVHVYHNETLFQFYSLFCHVVIIGFAFFFFCHFSLEVIVLSLM